MDELPAILGLFGCIALAIIVVVLILTYLYIYWGIRFFRKRKGV